MERRQFLRGLAAGAMAGMLSPRFLFGQATQPAGTRPNFIVILTDDHRWDALGVVQREQGASARFPWLKTPHLDKLAEEGVRFRNAFVAYSLCSPARATFLTGQYGYLNGVLNNRTEFPASNTTYATVLREAGYATGHIGKWHMGKQKERPGFDYHATFIEQGDYFDCEFFVNGESKPSTGWVDDVTTDYALEFLRNHKDKPFVMAVGYKSTHANYEPPERAKSLYEGEVAGAVPNADIKMEWLVKPDPSSKPASRKATDGEVRGDSLENLLNYFRCVTAVDENIGRLMAGLAELELDENTVIVFAGDNGFAVGERGAMNKRSAYEESMRIPLLMRYPKSGVKQKVVDQMVVNIDVAPTLLDLAGVPVPPTMQGQSWQPLLEGSGPEGWRKAFYYEYVRENANGIWPTIQAVRTEKAKLINYPEDQKFNELFDLENDPYETKNLIDDPSKKSLRQELEQELERLRDLATKGEKV